MEQTLRSAAPLLLLVTASFAPLDVGAAPKIIDMHLHADHVEDYGPPGKHFCMEMLAHVPAHDPADGSFGARWMAFQLDPECEDAIPQAESDDQLMRDTHAAMVAVDAVGVISGPPAIVKSWIAFDDERFVAGRRFNLVREADVTAADLAEAFRAGEFEVLAEVTNQYHGIAPDAPEMHEIWATCEELDIPVGIHMGTMPPGAAFWGSGARVALGNPLLIEEVLARHPDLRVYVMHAGMPYQEEMIALMQAYPGLYVDTGVLQAVMTEEGYATMMRRFVEGAVIDRVMFGSDQMVWPGMIERSVEVVRNCPALTEEQKQKVLYENAARFLRRNED